MSAQAVAVCHLGLRRIAARNTLVDFLNSLARADILRNSMLLSAITVGKGRGTSLEIDGVLSSHKASGTG